ncbi:MAG: metallopeptidase TldD-related protein [Cyanobacteria bacterium J06621_8]
MKDSIVEQIIDLANQRGVAAEVYYVASQATPIEFSNNRLKFLSDKASGGIALRVIADGKLGFASSTDLTRLSDLLDAAIATSEISPPVAFDFAENVNFMEQPRDYQKQTTEQLVESGKELIAKVHEYNSDILVDVNFQSVDGQIKLATTNNVDLKKYTQSFSTLVSGNLVRGVNFLEASVAEITRERSPDLATILDKLITKFQWAERKATISSGSYPVIFTPHAFSKTIGRMLRTILSGQSVMRNTSPLADKLGQKIFDNHLTVFEDPSLGVSACQFDDEGVTTRKKYLINQGMVQQFYWDRRWAARQGIESTGNGFRSGIERPNPSLTNLCLSPGQASLADLINDMDQGLIVDQILGARQSNVLTGEFSVNIDLGYKVEQGKIIGRVKDTMVSGNIFAALDNIVAIGDRPEWFRGKFYVPHILFAHLAVAARD